VLQEKRLQQGMNDNTSLIVTIPVKKDLIAQNKKKLVTYICA